MAEAIAAHGTMIKIGDGATPTENFTTIAKVLDITGPGLTAQVEDVTAHDSTGDFAQKLPTILDAGQLTFDVLFLPSEATHSYASGLLLDYVNKTLRNFQMVFPDAGATTWSFPAYVTSFSQNAPVRGTLRASVTLDINGEPTLA